MTLHVQHHVRRFQVAVHPPVLVQVLQTQHQLCRVETRRRFGEGGGLESFGEGATAVVVDDEEEV